MCADSEGVIRRAGLLSLVALLAACSSSGGTTTRPAATPATASVPASALGSSTSVAVDTTTAAGAPELAPPLIGFGLSPKSYSATDFPEFLSLVKGNADLLMHAGAWSELATAGSPFHVVSTLAPQQGMDTVIVISPSSAGALLRPLDATTHDAYLASLRAFLGEFQPAYLGVANEVNMLATEDPAAFEQVVELWHDALPIVRELSPRTKVFVTFQYEWLLGHRGGWFGTSADVAPDWAVVQRFDGADLVGLTTYPSLVVDDPAQLPIDYYAQLASHVDKPVIFTEVGWTADESLPLLPGSEAEQVAFIDVLATQSTAARVEAAVWSFVHGDQVTDQPFAEMDLRRDDSTPRPAWPAWLSWAGAGA